MSGPGPVPGEDEPAPRVPSAPSEAATRGSERRSEDSWSPALFIIALRKLIFQLL